MKNGQKIEGASLEQAIEAINKKFGEGSIMRLGRAGHLQVDAISSGSLNLDLALGIGGFPRGRICEIFGPESSGKTTLCLSAVCQAQRAGGTAVFIDAEHALDPAYARTLGVNLDELIVSQPESGEEAFQIIETLVNAGGVDVIVLDSVAALVSRAELDGEIGDVTVCSMARLMSQVMRRLTAAISKSRCVCIFTNQIREKIGVSFGSPETTPGGRALKFFSSVRLDIRRIATLKDPNGRAIGNRTRVKVVKNKVAPPFRECEFDVLYDAGISPLAELVDLALDHSILVRKGPWIFYDGQQIGQGKEAARAFLSENQAARDGVERLLKSGQA